MKGARWDAARREPATDRAARFHRSNWVASRIGLMSQLPDTDADFDDPDDEPITIKGEPISETIIRERR